MLFFFGGSRSWAAREARKKARQVRQKKRRIILRNVISVFSIMVLSVSIWSLMKLKHTQKAIDLKGKSSTFALGKLVSASIKANANGQKAKLEMPRPPVQPADPESMRKPVNASEAIAGNSEIMQRTDKSTTTRQEGHHASRKTSDGGDNSGHPARHDGPGDYSLAKTGSSLEDRSNGRFTNRRSDRAVRGMTQQETGDSDSSDYETRSERIAETERTVLDGLMSDIQKQEEVEDIIGSEEGGDDPIIIVEGKKHSSGNGYGHDGSVSRRDKVNYRRVENGPSRVTYSPEEQRRGKAYLREEVYTRDSRSKEQMSSRIPDSHKLQRGLTDERSKDMVPNVSSYHAAAEGNRLKVGLRGNVGMDDDKTMFDSRKDSHIINQYNGDSTRTPMRTEKFEKRDVRIEGENYRRDEGGVYRENDTKGKMERPFSPTGQETGNGVGSRMIETRDASVHISKIGNESDSRANDRFLNLQKSGSYARKSSASGGEDMSSGVTTYGSARSNGARVIA